MPEYLAPGVFVEETSFRSKSIEGVSTSTTAFVGPTRSGPTAGIPELVTSFADFERIYGGLNDIAYATPQTNYIAHAVMAYFNEGGARLYVARVAGSSGKAGGTDLVTAKTSKFIARFPGDSGNGSVDFAIQASATSIKGSGAVINGSIIRVKSGTPAFYVKHDGGWLGSDLTTAHTFTSTDESTGMELLTLKVITTDNDKTSTEYDGLGFDTQHKRFIGAILNPTPLTRAGEISQQFAFDIGSTVTAFELVNAFLGTSPAALTGGTDVAPALSDYQAALAVIEGIEDVSIVASPGYTELSTTADGVALELVSHAEKRRSYRIAVLDVPSAKIVSEAKTYKGKIDSKYAALYYPWVVAPNPDFNPNDPTTKAELTLPPSGFVCGIYARSDIERGVFKAPANEVVRSALRFERLVTTGEQEVLNPLGVNCLRYFAGRGNRVWGARTTSSDPEWKYVNIRRYFLYLEHSIDRGTQWSVFEPNGERLWANVRDTVTSFLYNEWVSGALLGDKPDQAFFVKCDRSTMTQNDLDNGRLICLVGVAAIKPAEFVIFRIGQKTADARS